MHANKNDTNCTILYTHLIPTPIIPKSFDCPSIYSLFSLFVSPSTAQRRWTAQVGGWAAGRFKDFFGMGFNGAEINPPGGHYAYLP